MLRKVRLELARTVEFPEGSSRRGYELAVPLAADGHIDVKEWRRRKRDCMVRRFWEGEDDEYGVLARTKGGAWAFSYEPGEADDEPLFLFESHPLVEGEYVTITEHDGVARPFRVVSVR